ncbi:ABC transporter substrate-binding protein [Rhizobium leguminosarum]|uniref:ABC transporter substrate-binding protein n=1 Tax=Rhizobium leguminosarum TaxID=384 RepID=UPI0013F4A123|nr:ABC transporter substrate-binding protein [Rhizobium leguminosarum]
MSQQDSNDSKVKLEISRRNLLNSTLMGGAAFLMPSLVWAQAAGTASGVLRIGVRQEPDVFNQHTMQFVISFEILSLVYEMLVGRSVDGKLTNSALAESWTQSDDGLSWSLKLKPELKWADGSELTVDDVVSSLKFVMGADQAGVALNTTSVVKGVVKDVEATSKDTVKITTEFPTQSIFDPIYIVPRKVWGEIGYDKVTEFKNPTPIIGSGPFVLKEWAQGQSVTLERNPHYRGPGPYLQELRFLHFSNPDAALQALSGGEIDYMTDVPINQVDSLAGTPNIVANPFEGYRSVYLGFNTWNDKGAGSTTALADPAFRDALGYAIDKKAIVDRVLRGYGTPATSVLVPAYGSLYPDLSDIVRPFDLSLAKDKLAKAGYSDSDGDGVIEDKQGNPIRLRLYLPDVETTYPAIAQFLTVWFRQVGVEVVTSVVSEASLLTKVADPRQGGGDYDMLIWFWEDSKPSFPLSVFDSGQIGGLNWSFWSDPEYDRLYQEYKRSESVEASAKVASEMARRLYSDGPYHVLFYPNTLHAYRTDRVSGWHDDKLPPLMNGVYPNPTINDLKITG